VFAKLYVDASDGDAEALAAEMIYTVVATASMTWACSYSLFFAHIKKGYAGTFIDTRSAVKYTVDIFNDPKASDQQKADVTMNTRVYWRSIEDERSASSWPRSGQRGSKRSRSFSPRSG